MKIAIRMDDISPNMNWENFKRFKAILDEHQIKPLIGVVPDNADPMLNICDSFPSDTVGGAQDFWSYVKELQAAGWIVAMHGMSHVYTTKKGGIFPLNNFSEFAGIPYEEQLELLAYGVDIFNQNGIETDIFMAPGHSFDQNTLSALKILGFTKITDGFGTKPYEYRGMTFYPISFKRSQTLKAKEGYSTFVYHANSMKNEDFISFENLLTKKNDAYEIISFSEYLAADSNERNEWGHLTEYVKAKSKFLIGRLINH